MAFYHASDLDLQPGDIILPGNWGRILTQTGKAHPCWEREINLELVRQSHYPDKPSRMHSAFVCDNFEAMKFYRNKQCPNNKIYEVEFVRTEAPRHHGDFNAVQPMPRCGFDKNEIAHLYWQYRLKTSVEGHEEVVCSEILAVSPLRVVRLYNEATSN